MTVKKYGQDSELCSLLYHPTIFLKWLPILAAFHTICHTLAVQLGVSLQPLLQA